MKKIIKKLLLTSLLTVFSVSSYAQIGGSNEDPNTLLRYACFVWTGTAPANILFTGTTTSNNIAAVEIRCFNLGGTHLLRGRVN